MMLKPLTPALFMLFMGIAAGISAGCGGQRPHADIDPGPTPTPASFHVAHHAGGRPRCMVMTQGLWVQSRGVTIEIVSPKDGHTLAALSLGAVGASEPVTAMAAAGSRIWAVLDGQDVCEIDVQAPTSLRLITRRSAHMLGIHPRVVSIVQNEVYVSGVGGVTRWSDGRRFLADQPEAGPVAMSRSGPAVSVGRRVVSLERGEYIGASSELRPMLGAPRGGATLISLLRGEAQDTVSHMMPDVRELARAVAPAPVRSIRGFAGMIWVITDEQVISYAAVNGQLEPAAVMPMGGVMDVAPLDRHRLALCGSFGLAVHWVEDDLRGTRWLKEWERRDFAGIQCAWSDGRRVMARNDQQAWSCHASDGGVQSITAMDFACHPPQREAWGVWGSATFADDDRSIVVHCGQAHAIWLPPPPTSDQEDDVLCIAAIAGELWCGGTRGIHVLRITHIDNSAPILTRVAFLRIDGDVRFIFPSLDGMGVAYITDFGGLGIVRR
jgi:hypothetical protein